MPWLRATHLILSFLFFLSFTLFSLLFFVCSGGIHSSRSFCCYYFFCSEFDAHILNERVYMKIKIDPDWKSRIDDNRPLHNCWFKVNGFTIKRLTKIGWFNQWFRTSTCGYDFKFVHGHKTCDWFTRELHSWLQQQ